jgi:hypothetical protein
MIGIGVLALGVAASPQANADFAEGRCVPIFSDDDWQVVTTGVGYGRTVTRPAWSQPWGSVIPNTRAQWVYADSFDTGPGRSPEQYTVRSFTKNLGSQLQARYNLESAVINVTADNGYVLYVTGTRVGGTFDPVARRYLPSADWQRFQSYDFLSALQQGNNTIRIDVYDHGVAAGFLLEGEICARQNFTQAVPLGSVR